MKKIIIESLVFLTCVIAGISLVVYLNSKGATELTKPSDTIMTIIQGNLILIFSAIITFWMISAFIRMILSFIIKKIHKHK